MSNVLPTLLSLQRTRDVPLDSTSVFGTYNALLSYAATDPTAYAGQICAVSGTNIAYIIKNDRTISSLAASEGGGIPSRFVVNDQLYYTTDFRTSQLSALSGNYDEGQFLGRVKLSQNNTRLVNVGNTWTAKQLNRFWFSVAISSDGKYQSATENGGRIYISSDYGNTWTSKESYRIWRGIAMSSDGKYQSAVVGGGGFADGQIYISSNYGNTWTAKNSVRNWRNIAISSDGKYQSATVNGGQIYISSDYGNTWTAKDSNRIWYGIAMSSDGKYQSATVENGQIYISSDYGNTWVAKDSSRYWQEIAMSSDGKYQSAVAYVGQIYVSSDYGNTWVAKDFSRSWFSIAMSSDGKYQSATNGSAGQIYISSDYGNTWTPKESNRNWRGIAMSSDGKYQSAVANNSQIYTSVADELIDGNLNVSSLNISDRFVVDNQLYYSTDSTVTQLSALSGNYDEGQFLGNVKLSQNNTRVVNVGNTWTAKESNRTWVSVAVSSDGKYQSAVVNRGQIFISSDYGNTWTAKESNREWFCIAMSSDGKYQVATGGIPVPSTPMEIYISSDYGNTWTAKGISSQYRSIAISSDGKIILAATQGFSLYISTNYGNNWIQVPGFISFGNWTHASMSSDGKYQAVTDRTGSIWVSNNYGNTWLSKTPNVPSLGGSIWGGLSMSSDGKYQTAVITDGRIYISNDYGNTWTARESNRTWLGTAMSSDGKYQSALVSGGQIYISSNYGNSWTAKDSNRGWGDTAMSSDGKYIVAVEKGLTFAGGRIYVSVADSAFFGNVGIETDSINSALTVFGNISASGTLHGRAQDLTLDVASTNTVTNSAVTAALQLLCPAPVYIPPIASLSGFSTTSLEIGSTVNEALSLNWSRNDAGYFRGFWRLNKNGTQAAIGPSLPDNYTVNESVALGTTTYELSVSFNTGPIPRGIPKNNILGFPDSRGQILLGSVTGSTSYTGFYRRWIGSNSTFPATPASIRTLGLTTTLDTNNILASQASPIYIDNKFILIAIPNTKTLTTVITEANENLTAQFTLSSIQIPDAGSTLRDYKLYYLETAVPLNANLTNVTIS